MTGIDLHHSDQHVRDWELFEAWLDANTIAIDGFHREQTKRLFRLCARLRIAIFHCDIHGRMTKPVPIETLWCQVGQTLAQSEIEFKGFAAHPGNPMPAPPNRPTKEPDETEGARLLGLVDAYRAVNGGTDKIALQALIESKQILARSIGGLKSAVSKARTRKKRDTEWKEQLDRENAAALKRPRRRKSSG